MADNKHNFYGTSKFYTRSQPIKMDKQLIIVRDKAFYNINDNQIDDHEHYKDFMKMKIQAPNLLQPISKKYQDKQDAEMKGSEAQQNQQQITQQISNIDLEEKVKPLDVPDLFKNVQVDDVDNWLQYPDLYHGNSKQVVPDYYIRHFDPVNDEIQNIPEKNWSFKKKNYEINEEKIQELIQHKINISPSDYEYVIDHFEKTAINDQQQSLKYLCDRFLERAPLMHLKMIEPEVMHQIYHKCWKEQREKRCNRPFIRMFWCYQDGVGPDNYQTFKISDTKNKPNMREGVRNKICKYKGAYQERQIAVKLCDQLMGHHTRINLKLDVFQIEDLEFDRIIGKAPPIIEKKKDSSSIRPINEDDINSGLICNQRFPVPTQHELDHLKGQSVYPNQDQKVILQGYMEHEKMNMHPRTIKMSVKRERQVNEIFWPKPVEQPFTRPVDPPARNPINKRTDPSKRQPGRGEPTKEAPQDITINGGHQKQQGETKKNSQIQQGQNKNKSDINMTIETASQEQGTVDTQKQGKIIEQRNAENQENLQKNTKKKRIPKNKNPEINDQPVQADTKPDIKQPEIKEDVTPAIELAHQYAKLNQTKKLKKYQYVDHDFIKTMSMVLHFQKKHLNLNITGDQKVERKFDIQNQFLQIKQSEQKNFQIRKEDLDAFYNKDPSKRPRHVVMTKQLRKIEQETRITREDFDQLFEVKKSKKAPMDEFEKMQIQSALKSQKKEEQKQSQRADDFDEYLFEKQQKLNSLNQEYQLLKKRQFQPRRGRNNRIFYKGMAKTVYDYDSNDENLMAASTEKQNSCQNKLKRNYDQFKNHFTSKIDKILSGQKTMIDDLEKHCRNKRLKKNIYKMDCIKFSTTTNSVAPVQKDVPVYNPAVTNASSDPEKLPRLHNDPVIDEQFKQTNARLFYDIMSYEAFQQIMQKGCNPQKVFESDFSTSHKLADFDEFLANRRAQSLSPTGKKDLDSYGAFSSSITPENYQFMGSNMSYINTIGGSTNISQTDSPYAQLLPAERVKQLHNINFFKKEGKTMGAYANQMQLDFANFKQIVNDNVSRVQYTN